MNGDDEEWCLRPDYHIDPFSLLIAVAFISVFLFFFIPNRKTMPDTTVQEQNLVRVDHQKPAEEDWDIFQPRQ